MTNLTPGPDLDRRVAEAVGWQWNGRPGRDCAACSCEIISCHVSERIGDEIEVSRYPSGSDADAIAALKATGLGFTVEYSLDAEFLFAPWCVVIQTFTIREPQGCADTLRIAACAAILAWKEGHKDE